MSCPTIQQPSSQQLRRGIATLNATYLRLDCLLDGLKDSNKERMFAYLIEDANALPSEYLNLSLIQDEVGRVLCSLSAEVITHE